MQQNSSQRGCMQSLTDTVPRRQTRFPFIESVHQLKRKEYTILHITCYTNRNITNPTTYNSVREKCKGDAHRQSHKVIEYHL